MRCLPRQADRRRAKPGRLFFVDHFRIEGVFGGRREVYAVKMNSALCASFVCFVIFVVIFVINTQILERTINCKAHKEHKEI